MSNRISKRSENIASAIYLITSFFHEQEPLKWKLRSLASNIVSLSIGQNLLGFHESLQELKGLMSVAKNAGLVSDANHSILAKELESYLGELPIPEVSQNFFMETRQSREIGAPRTEDEVRDIVDNGQTAPAPGRGVIPRDQGPLKEFGAVSVKKNSRKSIIIGLLKRKKEIMIKDVSPFIGGVSEKTIQRELLALVREGILRKEGEKRWTRYSLA